MIDLGRSIQFFLKAIGPYQRRRAVHLVEILYFLRDKLDAASFEAVLKVCEENQE